MLFFVVGLCDWYVFCGYFVLQFYCGKIDCCGVFYWFLGCEEFDVICLGGEFLLDSMVVYWDIMKGYIDCGIGDVVVDIGLN